MLWSRLMSGRWLKRWQVGEKNAVSDIWTPYCDPEELAGPTATTRCIPSLGLDSWMSYAGKLAEEADCLNGICFLAYLASARRSASRLFNSLLAFSNSTDTV